MCNSFQHLDHDNKRIDVGSLGFCERREEVVVVVSLIGNDRRVFRTIRKCAKDRGEPFSANLVCSDRTVREWIVVRRTTKSSTEYSYEIRLLYLFRNETGFISLYNVQNSK